MNDDKVSINKIYKYKQIVRMEDSDLILSLLKLKERLFAIRFQSSMVNDIKNKRFALMVRKYIARVNTEIKLRNIEASTEPKLYVRIKKKKYKD